MPRTFHPVEFPSIWQDYQQQPVSWLNSVLVHALVISGLTLPFLISQPKDARDRTKNNLEHIFFPIFANSPVAANGSGPKGGGGGGGGGGDRSPIAASKGVLPKFDTQQSVPPMAKLLNLVPKLTVTPTLIGQLELNLAAMQANMLWGDPNGIVGLLSNGRGTGGGIGEKEGTGIGDGKGPGFGPGDGDSGGYRAGVGGVTVPKPFFSPAPDYSEEARKAKFQGVVKLSMVIDSSGRPTDIRIVQSLGMGLDERAVEKMRTWKFIPAMRNRIPVPVRVMLEITFRLF